jgi:hypothetical protein
MISTVYTQTPLGGLGEDTDVVIDDVAGRLHREDEGGLVGMSWTLNGSECNYMELALADPGSSKRGAIDELLKVARSLV